MIAPDEEVARVSAKPPEHDEDAAVAARLHERTLADQLALKDRALDVAAQGITIADARLPDRPLTVPSRSTPGAP
jgi:hypothetical protein